MAEDDLRSEMLSFQKLENEFSRYRTEFQRTRDDVLALNGEIGNLKTTVQSNIADLRTSINSIATKLDEKSKPNWPAVALAVAMVPGVWLFVTTYTQNAILPTVAATTLNAEVIKHQNEAINNLQQSTSSSAAADVASRTDRGQLNERVRSLEAELASETATRRESAAATKIALAEIETQFCASDVIRNLMHANDMRQTSILWQKAFGTPYPTDNAYYPIVCHHSNGNG